MHHCEAGRADAWRFFYSNRLIAALVVSILLPIAASAASDPVTAFIVRADSLAQSGDDGALRGFVAENVLLASARPASSSTRRSRRATAATLRARRRTWLSPSASAERTKA